MKLRNIVDALNRYYLNKFPNAKGWFIGKEYTEPTKLNAYKKYVLQIFYHTPGKNHLAFTRQLIDKCPEGMEEVLNEKLYTDFLGFIFINLNELDKYEAV